MGSLKKQCDMLWAKCVKAKAGYMSEFSKKTERLHAHHIIGKPNYRLRYEIENGVCLTSGEHIFGVHHAGRAERYRAMIQALRGDDIFERLSILRNELCKTKLQDVKPYLEAKLKEYEELA